VHNGTICLSKPNWRKIDASDLLQIPNGSLLRQVPIKEESLNVGTLSEIDLPYSDKYFIISNKVVPKKRMLSSVSDVINSKEIESIYGQIQGFPSLFFMSNVVMQNNFKMGDIFPNAVSFNKSPALPVVSQPNINISTSVTAALPTTAAVAASVTSPAVTTPTTASPAMMTSTTGGGGGGY